MFPQSRQILRDAGPGVYSGPKSFGPIAIEVLNKGIRPFLEKWHPLLQMYEHKCPPNISTSEHEQNWEQNKPMRAALVILQSNLEIYANELGKIAHIQ